MPEPIPDLNRDHQCHFYQAPSGQRCGSPALKSEYYCYHHHITIVNRKNRRVLIDPEITCMEIPPIEDRASIFIALAAVVHRLAENTIDTRRAGQMIYSLQIALQALPHAPVQPRQTRPAAQSVSESQPTADTTGAASSTTCPADAPAAVQPATNNQQLATPPARTIPISKESLLYFLRSRHCANCNAELFPASELTERRNPGAPPEVIEEARPALPAPDPPLAHNAIASSANASTDKEVVILSVATDPCISPAARQIIADEPPATKDPPPAILPTLHAVASDPGPETSNLEPSTSNLPGCFIHVSPAAMAKKRPRNPHSRPPLLYTLIGARYPRGLCIRLGTSLHRARPSHTEF